MERLGDASVIEVYDQKLGDWVESRVTTPMEVKTNCYILMRLTSVRHCQNFDERLHIATKRGPHQRVFMVDERADIRNQWRAGAAKRPLASDGGDSDIEILSSPPATSRNKRPRHASRPPSSPPSASADVSTVANTSGILLDILCELGPGRVGSLTPPPSSAPTSNSPPSSSPVDPPPSSAPWPMNMYTVDLVAGFNRWKTTSSLGKFEDRFRACFPGQTPPSSSTFYEHRKKWVKGPEALKQAHRDAGRTKAGHWAQYSAEYFRYHKQSS